MLTNGNRVDHEKTTGVSWIIADYTVPSLFLQNIAGSFSRTEFRVQNNPARAVGELCGPTSP